MTWIYDHEIHTSDIPISSPLYVTLTPGNDNRIMFIMSIRSVPSLLAMRFWSWFPAYVYLKISLLWHSVRLDCIRVCLPPNWELCLLAYCPSNNQWLFCNHSHWSCCLFVRWRRNWMECENLFGMQKFINDTQNIYGMLWSSVITFTWTIAIIFHNDINRRVWFG